MKADSADGYPFLGLPPAYFSDKSYSWAEGNLLRHFPAGQIELNLM